VFLQRYISGYTPKAGGILSVREEVIRMDDRVEVAPVKAAFLLTLVNRFIEGFPGFDNPDDLFS
jgi:hypothetical protein